MNKIWLLPSVGLRDRASLPNIPAIYFAMSHGHILYVGKANDLYLRWNSRRYGAHHKLTELERYPDVHLSYWQRPLWRLDHDEAVSIDRYDPPLNNRYESRVWWIAAIDYCQDSLLIGGAMIVGLMVARAIAR